MVFSWDITKVVKKKHFLTFQDKSDWEVFTKKMGHISEKESDLLNENFEINKIPKLDLHGFSLDDANKAINKFIIQAFEKGNKKILVVTGKGSRSKSQNNPYISEKLSVLKYSIPEYIKNDENLSAKISNISYADLKHGGDGAIYIFLRKNKNL